MFPGVTPRHPTPRLLLVVAHPDDETFGCGSLLLAAAAAGWRTTVACATRGEAGELRAGADLAGRTLGDVRESELREAARLMGVSEVVLLGFGDSGMAGEPPAGSLAAAEPATVAEAVRRWSPPWIPTSSSPSTAATDTATTPPCATPRSRSPTSAGSRRTSTASLAA